jgi:hypothetical protein
MVCRPGRRAAHDQVGDGFHAIGLHIGGGNGVFFGAKAKVFQQLGSALCMRRVVAGGRVGGHAHQGLQKAHFLVKVLVDPGVQGSVRGRCGGGHGWDSSASWCSTWEKASTASCMSLLVVDSSGLWLMPEFSAHKQHGLRHDFVELHGVVARAAGHAKHRHAQGVYRAFPVALPGRGAGGGCGAHGFFQRVAQAAPCGNLAELFQHVAHQRIALRVVGGAQVQ